jgi:hypothetical protein
MIIRDDELDSVQTSGQEGFQETSPIDLGFRGDHRATEYPSFACCIDADGDQDGTIDDSPFQPHFLVGTSKTPSLPRL